MTSANNAEIRVSAHILVQLGEELVTDVEQAVLECVKNAYDADSPNCKITVCTAMEGEISQTRPAEDLLKFNRSAENVVVGFTDAAGKPLTQPSSKIPAKELVTRTLSWKGSVVIEDRGDGMNTAQINESWLVISGSFKRTESGPKKKTPGGRVPLGDKGVGRLGSMKLGDILRIESAKSTSNRLATAVFRWTDCETANTVDQIPVLVREDANRDQIKGTRVSVLGLRDIDQWKGDRSLKIVRSLARLISPFESKSSFPVVIDVDGTRTSLAAVTETLLARAVAEFRFNWTRSAHGNPILQCEARFKERLFRTTTGTAQSRKKAESTFHDETGDAFLNWLTSAKSLSQFKIKLRPRRNCFVELDQILDWAQIVPTSPLSPENPGSLSGAFYYFNLSNLADGDDDVELDVQAAAGIGIDKTMIKEMAGISILRDGFRVRSSGDWLGMSEGMTSGSTYNLRYYNTIGYFALTGDHNYLLVEKSDREGFVDNSAYQGFMAVAEACKGFANQAIESVRRAQDAYVRDRSRSSHSTAPKSAEDSIEVVENTVQGASEAKQEADGLLEDLQQSIEAIEKEQGKESHGTAASVLKTVLRSVHSAAATAKKIQKSLEKNQHAGSAVAVLKQDLSDNKERMVSLYESAAVGLSARGLAHEVRTQIVEIRKRVGTLDSLVKGGRASVDSTLPHFRAIRGAASTIASAAALIDPMLPRTRAVRESINLLQFVQEYAENRAQSLADQEIEFKIRPPSEDVVAKINRGRLLAVLDNLARNSVYWLRRGKLVMRNRRPKKIRVAITATGFTLSDTGPGVDPAYEQTLFDMFVTAKPAADRGQGLGLFIINELLAADDCSVTLSSKRNEEDRRYVFDVNLSAVMEAK